MRDYERMTLDLIDNQFDLLKKVINDWFLRLYNKNVVLFGCGAIGIVVYEFLKKNGIKVSYFADNSSNMWGG